MGLLLFLLMCSQKNMLWVGSIVFWLWQKRNSSLFKRKFLAVQSWSYIFFICPFVLFHCIISWWMVCVCVTGSCTFQFWSSVLIFFNKLFGSVPVCLRITCKLTHPISGIVLFAYISWSISQLLTPFMSTLEKLEQGLDDAIASCGMCITCFQDGRDWSSFLPRFAGKFELSVLWLCDVWGSCDDDELW